MTHAILRGAADGKLSKVIRPNAPGGQPHDRSGIDLGRLLGQVIPSSRLPSGRQRILVGYSEGSDGETELETIVDALEEYEIKRWPLSREPGGKG